MTQLERYPPLLLHSLLTAARRFDPGLYDQLRRTQHVDADRILGLFGEVEELGAGRLDAVMAALRAHSAYNEIVYLAGRNSMLGLVEAHHAKLTHSGGHVRLLALIKQLLPAFLGRSGYNMMSRGSLLFIEIRDSVFARDVAHDTPVCGFYAGFLAELGCGCQERNCAVTEVRCRAVESDPPSCLFQVAL